MIRNKVPQNEPVHDLLTDRFCDLTTFRCQVSLKIIQLPNKGPNSLQRSGKHTGRRPEWTQGRSGRMRQVFRSSSSKLDEVEIACKLFLSFSLKLEASLKKHQSDMLTRTFIILVLRPFDGKCHHIHFERTWILLNLKKVVQSARIADFRGNSTPLPSSGGSQRINQTRPQARFFGWLLVGSLSYWYKM